MGYPLPAGVLNTSSAYFYASTTNTFGPLIKEPEEQILVILNYTGVTLGPISAQTFTTDVSTGPPLVISHPTVDITGTILSFLVSGGILGQQYNITIVLTTAGVLRTDVFTINIPSQNECDNTCPIPISSIYSSAPMSNPFVNVAPKFTYGASPPLIPNILDFWFNIVNRTLQVWITDGIQPFWQVISGLTSGTAIGAVTTELLTVTSGTPVNTLSNLTYPYATGGMFILSVDGTTMTMGIDYSVLGQVVTWSPTSVYSIFPTNLVSVSYSY